MTPDAEESKTFWRGTWDQLVKHNEETELMYEIQDRLRNLDGQEDKDNYRNDKKNKERKFPNCKSPGLDEGPRLLDEADRAP